MAWGRKKSQTPDLPAAAGEDAGPSARVLSNLIETGARVQAPAIAAYVQRLHRKFPDATPADMVTKLEKHYLAAVTASGAAVGSAALVPGVGTLIALSLVAAETALFLETTAVFVLAVAEVHGISVTEKERRRMVVLGALAGDDGKHAVARLLGGGRTNGAWLSDGAASTVPVPALAQLNGKLMRYFLKKYTLKRGAVVAGKVLPAGIGAIVGGVGNRMMGKRIVENARSAFGNPPARWTGATTLRVLPAVGDNAGN